MSLIHDFIRKLRKPKPPVIQTPWGPVTESARLQAALNMRDNPEVKERVERLLARECGGLAAGLAEARRRYPEAYLLLEDHDARLAGE